MTRKKIDQVCLVGFFILGVIAIVAPLLGLFDFSHLAKNQIISPFGGKVMVILAGVGMIAFSLLERNQ